MREIGPGLSCFEGSSAEQSSGGPIVNKNGNVVAINIASFYDKPGMIKFNLTCISLIVVGLSSPTVPFALEHPADLYHSDINLPESPALDMSRNRIVGVNVLHSCFQQMLTKL